MGLSISGLGSGLDTASLVAQLMQAERIPQTKVAARQQVAQKQVGAWNDLRTKIQALQTAAHAVATPDLALGSVATSSDPASLRTTVGPGAAPGTYTVSVTQLAVAQQQSTSGLGPPSMTVGAGRSYLTAGPAAASLDLTGAAAGVHVLQVTRASSAPTAYGTPTTATIPTDLTVSVNGGAAATLTLRSTHTSDQDLLDDLNGQLAGRATASLVGGRLQLTGPTEGSASTLTFGGGAASALGLPSGTVSGQAAIVIADGVTSTVEPSASGSRAQALGPDGLVLQVGTHLSVGTTRANVVVTTDTSTLADLQAMVNTTGSPVTAAVVSQGSGSTLVLSSTTTGDDGVVAVTAGTPVLAGLTQTQAARNAVVTIAGQTVERSTNTLTDVVPGVTLDLLQQPAGAGPLTVTVGRDSSGTSAKAKALVDAMNTVLDLVASSTKYDVKGQTGGPLVGDSTARSVSASLFGTAAAATGSGSVRQLAQLGIQTTRDGHFAFDATTMVAALGKDPDGVAATLSNFAASLDTYTTSISQTGGLLTQRRDGAQADVNARAAQYDAMELRLTATQDRYKAQFAKLETTLAQLTSKGNAVSAALGSFTSGK